MLTPLQILIMLPPCQADAKLAQRTDSASKSLADRTYKEKARNECLSAYEDDRARLIFLF
jgi:hypothetical protein